MAERYIFQIKRIKVLDNAGNKAKMLRFLIDEKYRVPLTYVSVWQACINALKTEIKSYIDPARVVKDHKYW